MAKKLFVLLTVALLVWMPVFFAACDLTFDPDAGGDGGDLVLGIRRLYFDKPLVAAVVGGEQTARLVMTRFPPANTMAHEDVIWTSNHPHVLVTRYGGEETVNATTVAVISVDPALTLGSGDPPVEAVIRATYRHDPSVYVESTMMVLPDWPKSRRVHFGWVSGIATQALAEDFLRGWGFTQNEANDWHMLSSVVGVNGYGIFLLSSTGGAAPDPMREGGEEDRGVFVINPLDPYEFGIVPTGGTRPFNAGAEGAFNAQPFSFPNLDGGPMLARNGSVRMGGDGRIFRIMGLQAPFQITMMYQSNGAGTRWADIRFGDTSGIRVEGPVSPGNAAADTRTLRFIWDYYYEYDADGNRVFLTDEAGNRIRRDEFVPVTFIEAVGAMRFFDINIEYLGCENGIHDWVCEC